MVGKRAQLKTTKIYLNDATTADCVRSKESMGSGVLCQKALQARQKI